jgi:serine/threonine-protein kinase HipA
MAIDCGIQMTECKLLEEGERAHFMTKRFDRTDTGEKKHIQTLAAIAHFDRDERYSYEQIFQTMRRLHLPYPAMEQMYRRMVFNVIARNQDDHTKNHSFIMDKGGKWTLAPAYDMCYSYSPSGQWTSQHQLSLNGKRDNFTKKDLTETAKKMDIKKADETIDEIIEIISHWKKYAAECNVNNDFTEQIYGNLRLSI